MLVSMGSVERRAAVVARETSRIRRSIGDEMRSARIASGLSQTSVAKAAGVSKAEISRVERGLAPWVTIDELCRVAAPLGLDVSIRLYPAGPPIRDRAQLALLDRLRRDLPSVLRWRVEVGLPIPGDQRAWDAMIEAEDWRLAVDAETRLHDVQALERRVALKQRDDGGVAVLLLVNDTRHNRQAIATAGASLRALLPRDARAMLAALRVGRFPGGSGIVLL